MMNMAAKPNVLTLTSATAPQVDGITEGAHHPKDQERCECKYLVHLALTPNGQPTAL